MSTSENNSNCLIGRKHERATETLWLRTYVAGSNPDGDKIFFYYYLVIMYWTLNSIYVQFEYQCPKQSNVYREHLQVLRGMFGSFEPKEMLRSFAARGIYCLKLV